VIEITLLGGRKRQNITFNVIIFNLNNIRNILLKSFKMPQMSQKYCFFFKFARNVTPKAETMLVYYIKEIIQRTELAVILILHNYQH